MPNLESEETIYHPEKEAKPIKLTPEQKEAVRNITYSISDIDRSVGEIAIEDITEDIIKTLENGHSFNRLITNKEGSIIGYLACEDFFPKEAYIKYFNVSGKSGRSLFLEIPAFLEYAKKQGYDKLNFYSDNMRLNKALERFGFERLRTDDVGGAQADFYELKLTDKPEKESPEYIKSKRVFAFREKKAQKLLPQLKETIKFFQQKEINPQKSKESDEPYENRVKRINEKNIANQKKLQSINKAYQDLSARLSQTENFQLDNLRKILLKLKIARHFQLNDTVDTNTLYDAIIESPKYLDDDKGKIHNLLETHQVKTLERAAEIRKKRAEITGDEKYNPFEALFTTKSGKYYLARLLNMPHLKQESAYMDHCVGTSDSYINKMKKGEVEILSFRNVPRINPQTKELKGDKPIITIEYNLKTKTIEQIKKNKDKYLEKSDPYFHDVIDALKQLRTTQTDTGQLRDFKINPNELQNIHVADYHLLTENGEVSYQDFDSDKGDFIFKTGKMEITPEISKKDATKIIKIVEGIELKPEEIALRIQEVNENTKAYVGEWNIEILQKIKQYSNIKYLYEQFPDKKIFLQPLETDPAINNPELAEKNLQEENIYLPSWGKDILYKTQFSKEKQIYNLVKFTVGQLGFPDGTTTQEIYDRAIELGLELCPAEVGPHLRLQYSGKEWMLIAMNQIRDRLDDPNVFHLTWDGDQLKLDASYAKPSDGWHSGLEFVFCFRPSSRA